MSENSKVTIACIGAEAAEWTRVKNSVSGLDHVTFARSPTLRHALPLATQKEPVVFVVHESIGYRNIMRLLSAWPAKRQPPQMVVVTDQLSHRARWNLLALGVTACLPLDQLTRSDLEYLIGRARMGHSGSSPERRKSA